VGEVSLKKILYAPTTAYRDKVGDEFADFPIQYKRAILLNPEALNEDQATLSLRLPRLYAKHGPK